MSFQNSSADSKLLNPSVVSSISAGGKSLDAKAFNRRTGAAPAVVTDYSVKTESEDRSHFAIKFDCADSTRDQTLAILLTPDVASSSKPQISIRLDGKDDSAKAEQQEGKSQWHTIDVVPGRHEVVVQAKPGKDEKKWSGTASVWFIAQQKQPTKEVAFTLTKEPTARPLPPRAWREGEIRKSVKLGTVHILSAL